MGAATLDMWRRGWQSPRGIAGNLYDNMIERARSCGRVAGMLWYQGESDTSPELAATYVERFAAFVDDVRADLEQPDLPVITVQLSHVSAWPEVLEEYWAQVREAQRQAPRRIPGVAVVAAADLMLQDGLHLGTEGHAKLGVRMARAAARYVPGAVATFTTPDLLQVERDGDTVVCHVDGVNGSLRAACEAGSAGAAADLASLFHADAEVVGAEITGPATIVLRMAGEPSWVGYCLRYADQTVIADEAGLPLPAFGPVSFGK
jgi:hypothetical protein